MRLRNNPKALDILQEHEHYVVWDAKKHKGKWYEVFGNDHLIDIEIGMGKGDFILENAKRYPHINFIGIEKFPSVMVGAVKKIDENGVLSNLKLIKEDAIFLQEVFDENEVSRIYLNFIVIMAKKNTCQKKIDFTHVFTYL